MEANEDMWDCLALGSSSQSHGSLFFLAPGAAIRHCANPMMDLWICRSLLAAGREQLCLELFIRSLRHQPMWRLNWEGMWW